MFVAFDADDVVIFELRVFLFFATFHPSLPLIRGIFSQAVVIRVQYSAAGPTTGVVSGGLEGL